MKILLTFALLLTTITSTLNANTVGLSHLCSADNSIAELLKEIIEKEGITSYKVIYTNPKRKRISYYYKCTFPSDNSIEFTGAYNSIIRFNLNHLIRYEIVKKGTNKNPVKRLELLF